MFEKVLPEPTRKYLALLADRKLSQAFYLAGGTAVALHLGHRISVDLDFFASSHFDAPELDTQLQAISGYRRERLSEDTLLGALEDLRISFFWYRYSILEEPVMALDTQILQLPDLAAMKIEAIAQRNTKRDFIDLFFLAQLADLPPAKALEYHLAKYSGLIINRAHLILSLGYFDEADDDPMPQMLMPVSWEEVKHYFLQESKVLVRKFAG